MTVVQRKLRSRGRPLVVAAVAFAVLGLAVQAGATRPADGRPSLRVFHTHADGGEPTLGITRSGAVFVKAASSSVGTTVALLRTLDGGRSWTNVATGAGTHPATLDPYVYVDPRTDRVFDLDLYGGCSYLSMSDDAGASWTPTPSACGLPVNDHPNIFAGPAKTSTLSVYPDVVYSCYNGAVYAGCAKSVDGGLTFAEVSPPFGVAGGLVGKGAVATDGTVLLPAYLSGKPVLAVSHDEGSSWDVSSVANSGWSGGVDPAVGVDPGGVIYYTWIGTDLRPYLATSANQGHSWSRPVSVAPPGVSAADLPEIAVGRHGRIALAFLGDVLPRGTAPAWNGFIVTSTNAAAAAPTFTAFSVHDPGKALLNGSCGPGRCGPEFDFIDVRIAANGSPWAAFIDGCTGACGQGATGTGHEVVVATLVGGPSL